MLVFPVCIDIASENGMNYDLFVGQMLRKNSNELRLVYWTFIYFMQKEIVIHQAVPMLRRKGVFGVITVIYDTVEKMLLSWHQIKKIKGRNG